MPNPFFFWNATNTPGKIYYTFNTNQSKNKKGNNNKTDKKCQQANKQNKAKQKQKQQQTKQKARKKERKKEERKAFKTRFEAKIDKYCFFERSSGVFNAIYGLNLRGYYVSVHCQILYPFEHQEHLRQSSTCCLIPMANSPSLRKYTCTLGRVLLHHNL